MSRKSARQDALIFWDFYLHLELQPMSFFRPNWLANSQCHWLLVLVGWVKTHPKYIPHVFKWSRFLRHTMVSGRIFYHFPLPKPRGFAVGFGLVKHRGFSWWQLFARPLRSVPLLQVAQTSELNLFVLMCAWCVFACGLKVPFSYEVIVFGGVNVWMNFRAMGVEAYIFLIECWVSFKSCT